ncbi:MAG: right-handed parallel beta-helix repeat-containing protein, partial [candidate division Zixibacteria bacterium]|nr:right-handed parallel beta-helix repeat-containing protein [candidate division Zixibacteria bacterium]
MCKFIIFPVIFLLIFIAVCPVSATILHVPIEYTTIQSAIDVATDGDTVLIRPDIYYENIDFSGKNITVASYLITTGNPAFVYSTIIDGASSGPVVTFDGGEDSTAILYGLTIRHGSGKEVENYNHTLTNIYGGGIYIENASPSIMSNTVTLNKVFISTGNCHGYGAGIYCELSEAKIIDNIISQNEGYRESDPNNCNSEGGGIYCMESDVLIKGNTILKNTSKFGGGVLILASDAVVENNEIKQNQVFSIAIGAGIMCSSYSGSSFRMIIRNNVIKENEGNFGTGICCLSTYARIEGNFIYENAYDAISCQQGNDTIINNTICNNFGPALFSSNYANPILMNNILWDNNNYGDEIMTYAPGEPSISCCLVMGGWPGTGNIDADPQFCDPEAQTFTL